MKKGIIPRIKDANSSSHRFGKNGRFQQVTIVIIIAIFIGDMRVLWFHVQYPIIMTLPAGRKIKVHTVLSYFQYNILKHINGFMVTENTTYKSGIITGIQLK